jgi:hypothetical protein
MSGGPACSCGDRRRWRVRDYRCNYSAFNGYHRTPSDYSSVMCLGCSRSWRTKAAYVDGLPNLSEKERQAWLRGDTEALPPEEWHGRPVE